MEGKTIFILTTFSKLERDERWNRYDLGSSRAVGVFETIEEARRIIENNVGDICETIYDYGLIEEITFGLYPHLVSQEVYKVKDITVKDKNGEEVYNHDLTYERIELPEDFQPYCITIG